MPRKQSKARKGRKGRKMRMGRPITNNDFATAHQTLQLEDETFGTIYRLDDLNLSQFDRLAQIAEAYQFYRVKMIEMKFKPYQDTFFSGNTPGNSPGTVPYFHYLIDTGESLNCNSFEQLRDAGAKPNRFDDKTITVRWAPRINTAIAGDSSGVPITVYAASKTSPWLPTNFAAGADPLAWNASKVPHKGIQYGVWASVPGAVASFGTEVTVYMEFRKPSVFGVGPQVPVAKVIL